MEILALSNAANIDPSPCGDQPRPTHEKAPGTHEKYPKMPSPCTQDQNLMVRMLLEQGTPMKQIGPLVRPPVSYNTVWKMSRRLRSFGSTSLPKEFDFRGQPKKITTAKGNVGSRSAASPCGAES